MKGNHNWTGFTLIEILIVMIIFGVLASLAVSHFFKSIESSRAAEALASIGAVKRALEACGMQRNNNFSTCVDYNVLSMIDPSYNAATQAGAHFSYTFSTTATTYEIIATRNTLDGGIPTDTITLDRNATGALTRSGTTAFAQIQ